jgi:hypothetical protein
MLEPSGISPQKSYQNVTLTRPFCATLYLRQGRDAKNGVCRLTHCTFTTYRLQISQSLVVARIVELQLQQLQHFQHLQLFAGLHLRRLQHYWQNTAYMQRLWHRIAVLPLPPFVPIGPSDTDDISDNWPSLAVS